MSNGKGSKYRKVDKEMFDKNYEMIFKKDKLEESSNMLCEYCKKHEVEYSPEYFPYSSECWICPACDSTYFIGEYPLKTEVWVDIEWIDVKIEGTDNGYDEDV